MECEKCNSYHDGLYGTGRFCSQKCARSFSTADKREEINAQVSKSLTKVIEPRICKICRKEFHPQHVREICCSKECKQKNQKLWLSIKKKEELTLSGAKGSKGKYKRNPESILDLSCRTVGKILARLDIGCCVCGWNEAPCDLHHIRGRKIPDANNHSNLTYLCPNCHRLFHKGKLEAKDVICLMDQVGDRWKEFYYG